MSLLGESHAGQFLRSGVINWLLTSLPCLGGEASCSRPDLVNRLDGGVASSLYPGGLRLPVRWTGVPCGGSGLLFCCSPCPWGVFPTLRKGLSVGGGGCPGASSLAPELQPTLLAHSNSAFPSPALAAQGPGPAAERLLSVTNGSQHSPPGSGSVPSSRGSVSARCSVAAVSCLEGGVVHPPPGGSSASGVRGVLAAGSCSGCDFMTLKVVSCDVECKCTVLHSVYIQNARNLHFCYLDMALGYHVNNIEIHPFIKKYFYKKCFSVLPGLQAKAAVSYWVGGGRLFFKPRRHLLQRHGPILPPCRAAASGPWRQGREGCKPVSPGGNPAHAGRGPAGR